MNQQTTFSLKNGVQFKFENREGIDCIHSNLILGNGKKIRGYSFGKRPNIKIARLTAISDAIELRKKELKLFFVKSNNKGLSLIEYITKDKDFLNFVGLYNKVLNS